MKRKFLEDLGLEADVVEKIMIEHGKNTTGLQVKVDDLTEKLNVKEIAIQEKNTKIAEFEKIDVEAIKEQAKQEGIAEGSKEVESFKKQNALEKALAGYKAKDTNVLSKMLDMEKVKFNDKYEIVEGLEEQITPLKESHDYLFNSDKPLPKFADKTTGPIDKTLTKDDFKKMSYNQRAELKKNSPAEYENLKNEI